MDWFDLESFSELLTLYIPRIAGALITLVVGFIVIGWLTGLLRRTMERQKFDPTLRPFLVSLTNCAESRFGGVSSKNYPSKSFASGVYFAQLFRLPRFQ